VFNKSEGIVESSSAPDAEPVHRKHTISVRGSNGN